MRDGSRRRKFSQLCKRWIALKPILMLFVHILLPKQSNFKNIRAFENLGFVIMSTRENIRLIARAPYKHVLWKQLVSFALQFFIRNVIRRFMLKPYLKRMHRHIIMGSHARVWGFRNRQYEPGKVIGTMYRSNWSFCDLYIDLLQHQVLGVIRQIAHKVEIPAAQIVSFEQVYFIYHG